MGKTVVSRGKWLSSQGPPAASGRATAILFAREGGRLVLADWHEQGLRETLDLVLKEGGEAVVQRTNVAVEQDVRKLIEAALRYYAVIPDIVCNNAGIMGQFAPLEEQNGRLAQSLWGK